jgi:hypothetical protein
MKKIRFYTLFSLLFIIPAGIYTKLYEGAFAIWVNNSLCGAFYEIFWCMVFLFLFPEGKVTIISMWVLIVTCVLEFTQLWHPPILEVIRSTFVGRTIIGSTFDWSDFPYYFIGCCIAWYWMKMIQTKAKKRKQSP